MHRLPEVRHALRAFVLLWMAGLAVSCGGGGAGDASPSPITIDLTFGTWLLTSVDRAGTRWDGSTLSITSQVRNGTDFQVEGAFEWQSSAGSFGTELVRGTLFDNRRLELRGYQLQGANGIIMATYEARLSADGEAMVNGSWAEGVPGQWSAQRVLGPSVQPASVVPGLRGTMVSVGEDGEITVQPISILQADNR